jgi:1,4-dihydroxy-2-naphthoate polyprenyltransferase
MQSQETPKSNEKALVSQKNPASSQVIAEESVKAEEVPTLPLDSIRTLSTLQPEVSVHAVTPTQTTTVPEPLVVQPAEYRRSIGEWLGIWWDGMRPAYLSFAILPLILGSVLAWLSTISNRKPFGEFHLERFLIALIAVSLLQLGANLLNDYYDYLSGIDTSNSLGPGKLIQQGLIKPFRVLVMGLACLGCGALIGLFAAFYGGILPILFGIIGLLAAYFYSASRRSLSAFTLGQVTSFWIFGPFLTLGAYSVQVSRIDILPLVCSISLGLLLSSALYINDMRDVESDLQAHKRTLATLLSIRNNRIVCTLLLLAAYIPMLFLGFLPNGSHLLLITLWTLPRMAVILLGIYRTVTPASLHTVMYQVLKLAALFTFLLIVALTIATYWYWLPTFSILGLPFVL